MQSVGSIINKNISKENGILNTKINGFTKVPNLYKTIALFYVKQTTLE